MADSPQSLLDDVLLLVRADIDHIKGLVKKSKLDHNSAQDLARYAKVLQDIADQRRDDDDQDREKLKRMSTAELAKKAAEALERLRAQGQGEAK